MRRCPGDWRGMAGPWVGFAVLEGRTGTGGGRWRSRLGGDGVGRDCNAPLQWQLAEPSIVAAAALCGESGRAALLFEANDGLAAGDGDFTVDYGALRDGDAAGDDVSLDDGGCAYF